MKPYPDLESRSAQLFERAGRVLPGGNSRTTIFTAPYPVFAASGAGCRLKDVDGVERVDFINNYTSLIHGHAHPAIVTAVIEQVRRGTCFANPTEAEVRLAELLTSRVPSMERIRFTNSGSEAVMNAIKAARAYTGRPKIAKCEGLYHGCYDYAEVSLHVSPQTWGEGDPVSVPYSHGTPQGVLEDVVVIPFNAPEAAERILRAHAGELAAVLIDLMPARVGFVQADREFLEMLRRVTESLGILLIVDEVITFRLGYGGAQTLFGLEPELTTLGKIIGGGLPVGAVGGKAEVMAVFDHSGGAPLLPHGGTFNANPTTMVAGYQAMSLLTEDAFDRFNALGEQALSKLSSAFEAAGVQGRAGGMGSLFAIGFKEKPPTTFREAFRTPEEIECMQAIHRHLLNHGVIIGSTGIGALSTPMTEAEVDLLAEALLGALRGLAAPAAPRRGALSGGSRGSRRVQGATGSRPLAP